MASARIHVAKSYISANGWNSAVARSLDEYTQQFEELEGRKHEILTQLAFKNLSTVHQSAVIRHGLIEESLVPFDVEQSIPVNASGYVDPRIQTAVVSDDRVFDLVEFDQ